MAQIPFEQTIQRIRSGMLCLEATEQLAQVVKAVEETGKPGELNIKITIKRLGRSGALDISDKVTSKVPKEQPITTMMFVSPEGNLLTEDPRQSKLDLKTVPVTGSSDVISINHKKVSNNE
ncbi:hypothetical protein [Advenella sp. EE-W14]|uniref:hypothetical protein n=1 Tax=Advenella sp. EE-W14 TaxID=2722705 RepID=UPI00145E91A1|nr:hypothetical protein [Advenella sp. EE-W14]